MHNCILNVDRRGDMIGRWLKWNGHRVFKICTQVTSLKSLSVCWLFKMHFFCAINGPSKLQAPSMVSLSSLLDLILYVPQANYIRTVHIIKTIRDPFRDSCQVKRNNLNCLFVICLSQLRILYGSSGWTRKVCFQLELKDVIFHISYFKSDYRSIDRTVDLVRNLLYFIYVPFDELQNRQI